MKMLKALWPVAVFCLLLASSSARAARSTEECQAAWGKAARSYQTKAKPSQPADAAFKDACDKEAGGDKDAARVEAVTAAVLVLAKEDADACQRFLKSYVGAKDPEGLCGLGAAGDKDALKGNVQKALPAKK